MINNEIKLKITSDINNLLVKWIKFANEMGTAHSCEALTLSRKHAIIGTPSVVLSAIVSTSIFIALQNASEPFILKCFLGGFSMLASAFAAIVTFYNFGEKGARHKIASEEYMDIARCLQILQTSIIEMLPDDWRITMEGYSQRLAAIGRRVDLPSKIIASRGGKLKNYSMVSETNVHSMKEEKQSENILDEFNSELNQIYKASFKAIDK